MTFSDSVAVCFTKYADFSGRAMRPEFWWFFLFNVVVGVLAMIIDALLGYGAGGWGPANIIVSLGLLVPNLSVGARRLHDTGRSGWWQLLLLVPCVGVIALIVLWCQDTEGDNRYGRVPAA